MPELRSGSKKPGRGRGRGAGTSTRGTNPTPRGRGGTASRGRALAAPGAGDARQPSGDAIAVAEEEQAEPNPATLAAEPPAADMRGKEEGETDKDAPHGDEKGKDDDASTAPLPEKAPPSPPPPPPPPLPARADQPTRLCLAPYSANCANAALRMPQLTPCCCLTAVSSWRVSSLHPRAKAGEGRLRSSICWPPPGPDQRQGRRQRQLCAFCRSVTAH